MKLASILTAPIRLLDAPLTDIRRSEIVPRMAKDLIRYGAAGCEADGYRALVGNGYTAFEVVLYLPDAMQAAYQQKVDIVAKEVGKP